MHKKDDSFNYNKRAFLSAGLKDASQNMTRVASSRKKREGPNRSEETLHTARQRVRSRRTIIPLKNAQAQDQPKTTSRTSTPLLYNNAAAMSPPTDTYNPILACIRRQYPPMVSGCGYT